VTWSFGEYVEGLLVTLMRPSIFKLFFPGDAFEKKSYSSSKQSDLNPDLLANEYSFILYGK
jgi:hypothetical protein